MKLRSFYYALAALVGGLLLVGLFGFFWLTSKSPLALLQQETRPAAAIFVPKQAPAMASLLVTPEQLQAFRRVVTPPGQRRQVRAELEQLKTSVLSGVGLEYERDVQPWLGHEVTVAVTTLDIDRDDSNGKQPGYLLAIATQDPERSREFLQLFWQKRAIAGVDLVFEQYKGVKLIYGSLPPTQGTAQPIDLASAVVGNQFVLFANHPKVLRDAINNVQAEDLALASSEAYQQALNSATRSRIGVAFVNLPQLATWSQNPPASTDLPLYNSLVLAPGLTTRGLVAEASLLVSPGQHLSGSAPTLTQPVEALQFIPGTSLITAASEDLQHLWAQISQAVTGYDTVASLVNDPLTDLKTRWGIDLSQDVFNWVQGEYALGLLPRADQSQADWIFVAQRSPNTDAAIANLDAIAQKQGFSAGPLMLGETSVLAWTKLTTAPTKASRNAPSTLALKAQIQGLHTTAGNYEVFATSVEAMNTALQAAKTSIATQPDFQKAIAALPKPNRGYLHLDWSTSRALLEKQVPALRLLELVGKPFFEHLQSLTISSYGNEAQISRGAIFFELN